MTTKASGECFYSPNPIARMQVVGRGHNWQGNRSQGHVNARLERDIAQE
ncbi:MAG: hypothetical protein JO271_13195 [Verrucomicrobia bacterium]|nr:hypothetical protein [Verrucomicrobiota bacterium]